MNQIQRPSSNFKKDFKTAFTIVWADNNNDQEQKTFIQLENTSLKKNMTSAINMHLSNTVEKRSPSNPTKSFLLLLPVRMLEELECES